MVVLPVNLQCSPREKPSMSAHKFCFGLAILVFTGCGEPKTKIVPDTRLSNSPAINDTIDEGAITDLSTRLGTRQYKQIDSVLVVKDGTTVFEYYQNGYGPTKAHDIASITKSITSLLVGIAIDEGHIPSVDIAVVDFFKETPYATSWPEDKRAITIEHLLTMQHGIDCDDYADPNKERFNRWLRSDDQIASLLKMPTKGRPGETSVYCTASTQLLQQVIEQSTGQSIERFASTHLFEPLGIDSFKWEPASKQRVAMGYGADACPRDIAVLGRMIEQEGKWGDDQIVSSNWLRECFQPHGTLLGIDYGYLWYGEPYSVDDKKIESHLAMGHGGQFLILFPELQSIVVITASDYDQQIDFYQLIQDFIIPVCK